MNKSLNCILIIKKILFSSSQAIINFIIYEVTKLKSTLLRQESELRELRFKMSKQQNSNSSKAPAPIITPTNQPNQQ